MEFVAGDMVRDGSYTHPMSIRYPGLQKSMVI